MRGRWRHVLIGPVLCLSLQGAPLAAVFKTIVKRRSSCYGSTVQEKVIPTEQLHRRGNAFSPQGLGQFGSQGLWMIRKPTQYVFKQGTTYFLSGVSLWEWELRQSSNLTNCYSDVSPEKRAIYSLADSQWLWSKILFDKKNKLNFLKIKNSKKIKCLHVFPIKILGSIGYCAGRTGY